MITVINIYIFLRKKSFFFLTLVCVPTKDIFFVAQSNKFMRKYFFLNFDEKFKFLKHTILIPT